MAVLIGKVVRSGATSKRDGLQESSSQKTDPKHHGHVGNSNVMITSGGNAQKPPPSPLFHASEGDPEARGSSSGSQAPLSVTTDQQGILKTVETMILVDERTGDREGKRHSRTFVFDGDNI